MVDPSFGVVVLTHRGSPEPRAGTCADLRVRLPVCRRTGAACGQ